MQIVFIAKDCSALAMLNLKVLKSLAKICI